MTKRRAATPDTTIATSGDESPPVQLGSAPPSDLPTAYPVEDELPAAISPFGEVPRLATHWGLNRIGLGGSWDVLSWGAPGDPVEAREWPLVDLSVEAVRERWGAGTYRVQFLTGSDRNGRKHVSHGRTVTIRAAAPAAAPAPAPVSPFGPEMDRMLQMQRMIGAEASEKMGQVLQFATVLAGSQRGGLGAAELQLILQNQAAATEKMLRAQQEANEKAFAAIHAKLDAEEEDEDEDSGAAATAAKVAGGFIKGKGTLAMILNWANGNPEIAKEVVKHGLPIVASAATKIAEVISGPAPARPLPRAVPVAEHGPQHHAHAPVIAPTVPDIEPGSLRAWPSTPPASPAAGAPA